METKQDTITKLKNTLRSHKGHLTRHLKQLDRLVEFMATCPNDNTIQGLMDEQAAVQTQFNTLESLYTQLIDSGTPEDVESCAKRLDEMADQRTAALEKVSVALAAAQPSPRPPVNTQSTVGLHKPKVQEALRPFKLKTNHTPVDLRSWLGKFQAYFTSSGLHAYSAQEQHAFLFNCMTPDLEVRIKENDNFTQDMPLYSDDDSVSGVMTLLETEFLQAYPLFNRRLDFFRLKQAQGQTFSDFMLKLKQKGEEADLHKLNTEELYIFRYITGASDITLRERFLKLADPTLDDLKRAVRAYEVGLKAARGMDRENNRGMLVKEKKGQQRNTSVAQQAPQGTPAFGAGKGATSRKSVTKTGMTSPVVPVKRKATFPMYVCSSGRPKVGRHLLMCHAQHHGPPVRSRRTHHRRWTDNARFALTAEYARSGAKYGRWTAHLAYDYN